MSNALPDGYRLVDGPPSVTDYLKLRVRAGLSPKRDDQAAASLPGSWAACHVLHDGDDHAVAMGRLIGDGGWYFHVVDMAVLPEHQRQHDQQHRARRGGQARAAPLEQVTSGQ